jgi:hypothetical protein
MTTAAKAPPDTLGAVADVEPAAPDEVVGVDAVPTVELGFESEVIDEVPEPEDAS